MDPKPRSAPTFGIGYASEPPKIGVLRRERGYKRQFRALHGRNLRFFQDDR